MANDFGPEPGTDAADAFLVKLRALRESLPKGRAARYRLEEMERRLLDMHADSGGSA